MYYSQLTELASLVHDAIGERYGWLVTYFDLGNFFTHYSFAIYAKEYGKHLACGNAHSAFPFKSALIVVKRIDFVFHLVFDQETIEETVGEGDGQLVW